MYYKYAKRPAMNELSGLKDRARKIEEDIESNRDLVTTSVALITDYDDCDMDKASLHYKIRICAATEEYLNSSLAMVNDEIANLEYKLNE